MNIAFSPAEVVDMVPDAQQLDLLFAHQKQADQEQATSSYRQRMTQLDGLKQALLQHQQQLLDAMSVDYGHRSQYDSLWSDILPIINNINYTKKRLKAWMKPSKRHTGMMLFPAKVAVHYQPKGVVGIIVPWNFPVMLSLGPLISALAAGNRVMLKLSEYTPATNQVLKTVLSSIFADTEVAVVEGETEIAAKFSALPFDHLLFTGSTAVGYHVMRAAAENLTPVTLELGGKSPVIIGDDIDMHTAVSRLIFGKTLNSGQICVAPDYVFCPREQVDDFIAAYQARFAQMYPAQAEQQDYSQIINDKQWQRLQTLLADAKSKGAEVHSAIDIANWSTDPEKTRQLPTQLLTQVSEQMLVMQEEIFGPILPIMPYDNIQQVIDYINHRPRPLALYVMSFNRDLQQHLQSQTISGGMCVNDTLMHVAADDAPFGGTGLSGIGHYHGHEGFLTFSHAKTILSQGRFSSSLLIQPPYGTWLQKMILKLFLR